MSIEDSVKAKLRYWVGKLKSGEISIDDYLHKMIDVIEEKAKERYDKFFVEDLKKEREKLSNKYLQEREEKFGDMVKRIEASENILNDREKKISEREKELLSVDPKYFAAKTACQQAMEAANELSDLGEHEYYRDKRGGKIEFKANIYTRQQLVRTIGVIWAAAFGMQYIGGNAKDENGKENK